MKNRPIRETLQATGMMLSVRPIGNEDWQSMYTNVGFPGDVMPTTDDEVRDISTDTSGDTAQAGVAAGTETSETPADTTQSGNR